MLAILLMLGSLASSSYGKTYNCTADGALCTGTGARTMTLNGVTVCCPAWASISVNDNNCVCTDNPADNANGQKCFTGINNCRGASSFSTDSAGQLHCCPLGSYMHMVSAMQANGKGQMRAGCTCYNGYTGGVLSPHWMNGGMLMSALGGNNNNNGKGQNGRNDTAAREQWRNMGEAWKNWGQQFSRGFGTWGRNFGQNMRRTGLDLAHNLSGVVQSTLTSTTVPIQRALNDMIRNIFRSIPRY
ncbi:hypothetical protein ACOMHN_039361 [Nucella lapillus]